MDALKVQAALFNYYLHPAVRSRILEFLGATSSRFGVTSVYATAGPEVYPGPEVLRALERPAELNRSLWDRRSLVAHLDIEHVHFDRPWDSYSDPQHTFAVQRPVVDLLRRELRECGIHPLHLLSGRGHHLVWRLRRDSAAFAGLARLGEFAWESRDARLSSQTYPHEPIDRELCVAYQGLGMVMELLGHTALGATMPVPLQLTAVEAGPGPRGREIVSLDLSEYGDPLQERTIRVPFSLYLKGHREGLAPLVMLPLHGLEEAAAVRSRRDLDAAWELAEGASVGIPEQSSGTEELLRRYGGSELAKFHRWFYSVPPTPFPDPDGEELPACVRLPLEEPNDLLLRPAVIQNLVRTMLAWGWHPRPIAGLLRARYQENHAWQSALHFYSPDIRADFYGRLFAGLVVLGTDRLVDYNCRSCQEKGYCPVSRACRSNLADLRETLRERFRNERLAGGVVDRMLLSTVPSRLP